MTYSDEAKTRLDKDARAILARLGPAPGGL